MIMKTRSTALLLCAAVFSSGLLNPPTLNAQGSPKAEAQGKNPTVVAIEVQYAGPVSVSKDRLMAHMRTRVGQPFSEQVVEEDIRNLYATGNIVNVRIYADVVDKGVKVIVVLQAKAVVSSLEVVGSKEFKASRLLDKVQT